MLNKEKTKINLNKKNIFIIIFTILLIIIAGTFAWFTWKSNDSRLVLTVGNIDDAQVILKPYQINKEITPVLTYEEEDYTEVEAINKNTNLKRIKLYYHINNIDSELISNEFKYTILRSTDNGTTYSEYLSGNFINASNNNDLYIMNERITTNTNYKYKVYLWLNGSSSSQEKVQGKKFEGELRAEILDGRLYANLGGENELYKVDDYREKITKVEFVNNIDIPSGSTTFELGTSPSEPTDIMGWLVSNGTDTYTLKIGANDKIYANSLALAFRKMNNLKEIAFDNLDTSQTTNMSWMFSECNSIVSLDLGSFDTSNVTDMNGMFSWCSSLTNLDLDNFDTSNVTNMSWIFSYCNNLTSLNLSNFNTSNVTDMSYMFYSCYVLSSLNISNFDTSKVNNMEAMFFSCRNLSTLDLSNFNTSNVVNMIHMFCECLTITSIDLSSFNTSKVTNMYGMFANCPTLTTIYVSNLWNTSLVSTSTYMFSNSALLPNYNSSVIDKTNAHYNTGGYLTYKA